MLRTDMHDMQLFLHDDKPSQNLWNGFDYNIKIFSTMLKGKANSSYVHQQLTNLIFLDNIQYKNSLKYSFQFGL